MTVLRQPLNKKIMYILTVLIYLSIGRQFTSYEIFFEQLFNLTQFTLLAILNS